MGHLASADRGRLDLGDRRRDVSLDPASATVPAPIESGRVETAMIPSLSRFAGTAAAIVAVLCAAGAWPTHRAAGGDGLVSMAIAAGVTLACAIAGYVPAARSAHAARLESRLQAAMLGILVRLFATLAAVFAVLQTRSAPSATAFVIWIGLDYAALLVLETRIVAGAGRATQPAGGT